MALEVLWKSPTSTSDDKHSLLSKQNASVSQSSCYIFPLIIFPPAKTNASIAQRLFYPLQFEFFDNDTPAKPFGFFIPHIPKCCATESMVKRQRFQGKPHIRIWICMGFNLSVSLVVPEINKMRIVLTYSTSTNLDGSLDHLLLVLHWFFDSSLSSLRQLERRTYTHAISFQSRRRRKRD